MIVIDPNGLGRGQPSVGFGYRMMEKYGGLSESTLSDSSIVQSGFEGDRNKTVKLLKLPSGTTLRVTGITGYSDCSGFTRTNVVRGSHM